MGISLHLPAVNWPEKTYANSKKSFWLLKKSEVFIFKFESLGLNSFTPTGLEFLLVGLLFLLYWSVRL